MPKEKKKTAIPEVTPIPTKEQLGKMQAKQQLSYNVPEELDKIMEKRKIYVDLRIKYINKKFGYRKAIKCSKKMIKLSNLFFNQVVTLYPELSGRRLSYDDIKKIVTVIG